MNFNDRFLRGVLVGLGVGGVAGYLLAGHLHRNRLDAELSQMREHYRAKSEDLERRGVQHAFCVVPTGRDDLPAASFGFRRVGGFDDDPDRLLARFAAEGGDVKGPILDSFQPADAYAGDARDVDPELGLDDDDYEPDAARSLGVDGSGNPVEDEFADLDAEADGSEDDGDNSGGHEGSAGGDAPDPRGPGPYLITEREFSEEQEFYQKLTVIYYRGDNVLIDSAQAVIPDIRANIGAGTTDQFGKDAENPHVLYVRNDKIQVDFEICLDYGSYVQEVLHYGTANPKPPRLFVDGG